MFSKKDIGNFGESLAKKHYQEKGYKIIAQNYWTLYGEIDLVVVKDKQVVLVEVKTRRSDTYGWAEESISQKKIQNILRSYEVLRRSKRLPDFSRLEILVIQIRGKRAIIKTIEI